MPLNPFCIERVAGKNSCPPAIYKGFYSKRVSIELYGNKGFAYVAIDTERQKEEQRNYINRALDDPKKKMSDEAMNFLGYFVLREC
jgi:hypothetical protein